MFADSLHFSSPFCFCSTCKQDPISLLREKQEAFESYLSFFWQQLAHWSHYVRSLQLRHGRGSAKGDRGKEGFLGSA